jgi:Na+(H+)/acetate symporter ActP
MWAFAGTYSGMMAAMIGGLVVSVVLYTLKRTIVREVLVFETRNVQIAKKLSVPVPTYQWVTVNPA